MSTIPPAGANEPKRERGRLRVAAIMDAGIEVFTEKGFDAATMTEIAARSGTAIGSLYRFFPSKESLADALLLQYTQYVTSRLAELEERIPGMPSAGVAEALVDFMVALQSQRSFAIALIEGRGGHDTNRLQFRETMRSSMAKILRAALPGLTPAKSKTMGIVVLHALKAVADASQETPAVRRVLVAEIRDLLRIYLASADEA